MDLSFRTPWGKLLRTDIVQHNHILFNEKMKIAEDTLFMFEYYQYCRQIVTTAYVGYHYYIGSRNDSKYALTARAYIDYVKMSESAMNSLTARYKVDLTEFDQFLSGYLCHLYFTHIIENEAFSFRGYKEFKDSFRATRAHIYGGRMSLYGICTFCLKHQLYGIAFFILRWVKPMIEHVKSKRNI